MLISFSLARISVQVVFSFSLFFFPSVSSILKIFHDSDFSPCLWLAVPGKTACRLGKASQVSLRVWVWIKWHFWKEVCGWAFHTKQLVGLLLHNYGELFDFFHFTLFDMDSRVLWQYFLSARGLYHAPCLKHEGREMDRTSDQNLLRTYQVAGTIF